MGKIKQTKKFAVMKRMINLNDPRLAKKDRVGKKRKKKSPESKSLSIRQVPQVPSALYFKHNTKLGPPYHVILDTNFINHAIKNKLEIVESIMDCLYAQCTVYITDCVVGELEKLGGNYRVALKIVKDERFKRLTCQHKGTYADDCIVRRVTMHKCYIVATCDKDLKRRIRRIPGVPIMYISQHRFSIERIPEAYGAPKT